MKNIAEKVKIRKMRPSDIPLIVRLGRGDEAFKISERYWFFTKKDMVQWLKEKREDLHLVAELDERIIGFLCIAPYPMGWSEIEAVYVRKKYRGLGVSKLLLETAYAWLKKRKVRYIELSVRAERKDLISYWTRQGFRKGYGFTTMEKEL